MNEQVQTFPARLTDLAAADVFADETALAAVLDEIEQAARSIAPDVSTKKGRDAVASLAFKVARSKTFLDEKLGKPLVADWKAKAAGVDRLRKIARDRLDALKAEVRQPLTDWEQAEADRQAAIRARIQAIRAEQEAAHFQDVATASAEDIEAALERVAAVVIDDSFAELRAEAEQVKDATLYRLSQLLTQVRDREAAEAAAAAQRQARERRERAERDQRIAAEAAERARREAEQAAAAERERQDQARLAAERRAREAEQAAAEAAERERQRLAAEQARERAEAAARAADREHQAQINREVLADLCDLGLDEATAKRLIAAIARGQVAHVAIAY